MACVPDSPSVCYNQDCCWSNVLAIDSLLTGVERIGIIGDISQCSVYEPTSCETSSCSSSTGKCKESGFSAGDNGQSCTAMDREVSGLSCNDCFKSGYWDYSDSKCVECNGNIGGNVWGNTTQIADTCNNIPLSYDNLCESACGASTECDEKNPGDCSTASWYKCNSTCQKISSCGDGTCNCWETCSSCSSDCGACDICPSGDCCDTTSHPYQYRPSTYVCRASAGDCDIEEKCTGLSADCPSNSYRPSTYVCDDQYDTDYGCPDGTACGYDVGVRYKTRKCPGDGTDCSGTISGWGIWTTYDNCSSTETCTDDDSTCNYTPSCAPCDCTGWTNQSCGYSGCSCPSYNKGQTRTCTPSGCDVECQCICDESCCTAWTNDACGAGGCAATEMHQTRGCGTCSYATSRCISDPSCGGVVSINPPVVITIANPTVSEDPSHPGKYRAILTGFLDSLGYVPGTCPSCKCIVWFKWGTSGSYGNSNTPVEMTTEDDYFYLKSRRKLPPAPGPEPRCTRRP